MENPSNFNKTHVVLAIGGLDPSGGAGVLLDATAIRATQCHCAAVVAVNTVQEGDGFRTARCEDSDFVHLAATRILKKMDVQAVKTGALGNALLVETVEGIFSGKKPPLVVDPVLKSTTGGTLLDESGIESLKKKLLPKTRIVTPNLEEAQILTGSNPLLDLTAMRNAARRLLETGVFAVLVKGGHLPNDDICDVYADQSGLERVFRSNRAPLAKIRGTGCALASLIAGRIARGDPPLDAVTKARDVLSQAIWNARYVGTGPPILAF